MKDGKEVSTLLGSWLGFVDWDGKRYWNILTDKPETPAEAPNPLPSDSRFRLDRKLLAEDKLDEAQQCAGLGGRPRLLTPGRAKTELEEYQRRDRRLRKEALEAVSPGAAEGESEDDE